MRFVHFMRPDGTTVPIQPEAVQTWRAPFSHEMAPNTHTILMLSSGAFQGVRETPAQVEAKLVGA
jgi:hypothetical protein